MLLRRIGAGFLAGASSIAGLLLLIVALVFIAGIFGLIRDIASQVYGDITLSAALAQSMGSSLRALPGYLWSARWGMVALGLIGIVLALVDQWRARITRSWRDSLGYIVTNMIVASFVISALYLNNDAMYRLIADQPSLYSQQSLFLVSDWALVSLGVLAAIGLGYVVWAAWQWWYDRWALWLRVSRPPMLEATREAATPSPSSDDWRAYQDRLMRLKRQEDAGSSEDTAVAPASVPTVRSWLPLLAGAVAVLSILVIVLLRTYHSSAVALVSGEFWLEPNAPAAAFGVDFPRTPQHMTFSNTSGSGLVDIQISDGSQTLAKLDGMPLAGGPGFHSEVLDLQGLKPGRYRVDATLREGAGGLVRYIGLYGGGWLSRVSAVILGLVCGAWMGSLHTLVLELIANRGRRI